MAAQFACSSYLWTVGTSNLSCQWKLYKGINLTVFYSSSSDDEWRAAWLTYLTRVSIGSFSYFFYLTCNIFLLLDLYFMLKEPFKSKESRLKWYYLISFIIGSLSVYLLHFSTYVYPYFSIIIMCSYLFSVLFVTCYSIIRIRKSCLSNEVKNVIWRKHFYWIFVFVFSNSFVLVEMIEEISQMYASQPIYTFQSPGV